jgi:hypothetical protein
MLVGPPNQTANELFDLVPTANNSKDKSYHIKTFCNKAVDVSGCSTDNETEIIQWDFSGQTNQVWYFVPI